MRTLALILALSASSGAAAAPAGYFDLGPGVALESGDSWTRGHVRYHLYGVQSCLRGTIYTDAAGNRKDCGEASLAVLSAFIADAKPICAPVATSEAVVHVVCYATVGSDLLDLGDLLITSGFAFAALKQDGRPYSAAYAVVEQTARKARAGLWGLGNVQHPAILLGRAAAETSARP